MHSLIQQLTSSGPTVLDGGWGSQLQERGLKPGDCPDAWNLTHRAKVEEVARAYIDAGSDVILTNTFGANRFALAKRDLADQVADINRAGVEISRHVAGDRARVFASVGPSGVMLMMGDVSEEELVWGFQEQVRAIAQAGADAIVIETMADPAEIKLVVQVARQTGLPVVGCMVFDSGADMDRTMMGTTPEQAAELLTEAGADVVGSNCGQGIAGFVSICKRLRSATDRPIWIKANAGLPERVDGKTAYAQTAAEFAEHVPELVEAGADFIGGCCGTTPEFIRAVGEKLR